jgi:hypothetical protein
VISSTTPGGFAAGVRGINNGASALGVGVYGSHSASGWGVYGASPSGIGVYGSSTAGFGVVGSSTSGPALAGVVSGGGGNNVGLLVENGAFKVGGVMRTAFVHTSVAGNTFGNVTTIDNPLCNNAPTAMLFVTRVHTGGANFPKQLGVLYEPGIQQWRIFVEDLTPMPLSLSFNVLIIRQ